MRKQVLFYIYIVISTQTSKLSPTFLKIILCSKWLWYIPNINALHRLEICLFQVYLKCTSVNIFFAMYFVPGPILIALHLLTQSKTQGRNLDNSHCTDAKMEVQRPFPMSHSLEVAEAVFEPRRLSCRALLLTCYALSHSTPLQK